jgi:hypothetical protein
VRQLRALAIVVTTALLAAAHVGCFSKPDAPHLGPRDGAPGGSDAMVDAASERDGGASDASPLCPQPSDTFDMGTACGPWGQDAGSGGTPTRKNGQLVVSPTIGMTSGCRTNSAFSFANGSTIEIPERATSGMPGNVTFFSVTSGAGSDSSLTATIDDDSGTAVVNVTCTGGTATVVDSIPYSIGAHRWIRFLRNSQVAQNVEVWVSGDGSAFNLIPNSACGWTSSPDTVVATMGVTTGADISTAKFDNFNTNPCPP